MAKLVSAAKFAAFIKERIAANDGYIMGATGQNPKGWSVGSWWFTQYKKGAQRNQALSWRAKAKRVWDCNGLAEGYYKDQTGTSINTRARNNYASWCGKKGKGIIPASMRVPGAAVFHHNGVYIHHVGFLLEPVISGKPDGDWYVGEARGVYYGVVRTKLYDKVGGKARWNRWGLMTKYYDYTQEPVVVAPVEPVEPTVPDVVAPADPPKTDETAYPAVGHAPDVSAYQNISNMNTFCSENLLVFARFWVNLLADIKFKIWAVEWAKRNFPFWMYIFFKVRSVKEAERLADKTVGYYKKYGPRGLVVDLEALYKGVTYEKNYTFVRAYIARCRAGGIERIGLYTGEYRYKAFYYKIAALFDFLWIANYGKNTGYLNSTLDVRASWHQYTSMRGAKVKGVKVANIPGVKNRCDDNRFIGAEGKDLSYFTGRTHVGVPYHGVVRLSKDANMRVGASANTASLGVAKAGYELELIAPADSTLFWYAVKFKDKPAFVPKSLAKAVKW